MNELSPMMQQYMRIKEQYKDAILFFRLGDFYEMFYDDAKLVSSELDLTLTGKDCGQNERAPMCGIPYHSCDSYIARLVSKGYKVAMCDQVENPAQAKGVVKREVVRVITPGTVMEECMLDESQNNYICSIHVGEKENKNIGLTFCDISTGELKTTEINNIEQNLNFLKNEIGKFYPKEILFNGDLNFLSSIENFLKEKFSCRIEKIDKIFSDNEALDILLSFFDKDNLINLNLNKNFSAINSMAILFEYLKITQKNGLERIEKAVYYDNSEYMRLDLNTIRNLEITETMRKKSKKGSLLWVLDKTKTAMGKRMFRSWIERPLINVKRIKFRQDGVDELYKDIILRDAIEECLVGIHDMERIMTKITYGSANGRDLKSLSSALSKLPKIKNILQSANSKYLINLYNNIETLEETHELIENAIVDEPPFLIKEGGIIKPGYSEEVDNLHKDMNGGKIVVAEIEKRERESTGIPKLKIGYNRVFGYYIEVSNSSKNKVPQNYIRKQTLTNCERFITEELKNLESRILYARDKVQEVEYQIFEKVRLQVAKELPKVVKSANTIAKLDIIRSLAEVAFKNNYVKPEINNGDKILIKEGRHPVVESLLKDAPFVPNNANLNNSENMVSIITGPNMAGKSTYMRQTAIIVLMAQIGSFVPANKAEIGVVDSIFTRIGASDDLASGQSTFMLEMNEVADILKNATKKSLLILDEIGRGTSTFDGMSIAKAVLEYVSDNKRLGAKTLFATHYHELTSMVDDFDNIKNYNIAVKKHGDDITFLRRIVPGAADDSYGIEVAKLSGIPDSIISRAKTILKEIESDNRYVACPENRKNIDSNIQLKLSDSYGNEEKIMEKLKSIDVSVLTPIEAINILYELVKYCD